MTINEEIKFKEVRVVGVDGEAIGIMSSDAALKLAYDQVVICTAASQYGFRAYQLNAQDDDWKDKILRTAEHVRKIEHFE